MTDKVTTQGRTQAPPGSRGALFRSPSRLFFIVAAAILAIEALLMFVLVQLPPLPHHVEALVDAVTLTILLLPFLYVFMFRPLRDYIGALSESEEALRHERDHLEELVQARTAELAEREVHYRAVVEGATEGILTLDRQGHVVRENAAAEKMFGYGAGGAIGVPFAGLLAESGIAQCMDADGALRPVSGLSLEARNKTGGTFPVLLSLSAFTHRGENYFTAVLQDISERVVFEKRLARLAYYDSLTGLPNRRLFHDRLDRALGRAKRNEKIVGILFLDLDHFKEINDTLGHLFGDLLLQEVAKRLAEIVRKEDTVARLGGDEFTVVLENISYVEDAERVAEKILHSLRQPFQLEQHQIYVTTSIGITFYPLDDSDIERLIMNADSAMYQAKSLGRNTYRLYTAEIMRGAEEKLALETALRQAVESAADFLVHYQPEFVLHYQPEIDRYSGEVVGVEALVRWRHPKLGLLNPERFIPLSEETGLIVPLGEWVLRTACKQSVAWRAVGLPSFRVAVNVSPRQLQNRDIVRRLAGILEETRMEARYLELELTESTILDKTEELVAILHDLKRMGITISIDDFGTGHSSLANLQLLPIDKIKIDVTFVRNVTTNKQDAAIVDGIIEMAHRLGLKVVAEGVETEEQLMYLLSHHCDIMQGYHFSRPMAATDLEAMLVTGIKKAPLKG